MSPLLDLKIGILREGLTQRVFAGKVGLREQRLSEIIRGVRKPNAEERERIAATLGAREIDLFHEVNA